MTHPIPQATHHSPAPLPQPGHPGLGRPPELHLVTGTTGVPPAPCTAATARRVARAAGTLASRAVTRLNTQPWFAAMPPHLRATAGLIAQDGITVFARWLRHPQDNVEAATAVFTSAPPETPRLISLQQAVALIRIVVDVIEAAIGELATPGDDQRLHEALLHFSRELGFATAFVYARAAEQRGAWDARLEALVIDAILRGDVDDSLLSRAAILGWASREHVVVVAGRAPEGTPGTVLRTVHHITHQARLDALAGVQGDRLIIVLGNCPDGPAAARALLPAYAEDTVVVGPVVDGLAQAHHSAAAALAGLRAACMRPEAPRPVAADDLLPERALDGDPLACQVLLEEVHRPLKAAGEALVATVAAYLQTTHSVEAAARRLFVHPNTVRYRLGRAAAACGRAATDPRDAQVLQVALALGRRAENPSQP